MAVFWEGKRRVGENHVERSSDLSALIEERPIKNRMASAPKKLIPALPIAGLLNEEQIAEYEAVAAEIGVSSDDIMIEKFRVFLAGRDLPVFKLAEVVAYMDEAAARDNPAGWGWHWCPVREKDTRVRMTFGRPAVNEQYVMPMSNSPGAVTHVRTVASDFFQSHQWMSVESRMRLQSTAPGAEQSTPAYTRTIPLHAMKKVALIERQFSGDVIFLISDYATAPHAVVGPDPFLMAVIPNSAVSHGKGRFVIDVWDEPGFGIDRMIK